MAEEKAAAKVELEEASETAPPQPEAVKDVEEEKMAIVPASEEKPHDSKTLAIQLAEDPEKSSGGSDDRDAALAKVVAEKRLSLIKAWEENEKVKAEDKALKKILSISSWEKSKMAQVEAEKKKKEEELEKKKVEYAEEMKNKIALIHKEAEEKKAMAEARRGEDILKAEEKATKYRATGLVPVIQKRFFGLFGA